MPTYQYRCTQCGNELEVVQKFTDPALSECDECHGALRKVYNAVGVVFKGSGFYRTDSRADSKANGAGWPNVGEVRSPRRRRSPTGARRPIEARSPGAQRRPPRAPARVRAAPARVARRPRQAARTRRSRPRHPQPPEVRLRLWITAHDSGAAA